MTNKRLITLTLEFSTGVLGPEGAQRLKDGKVTQTIRSRKSAAPLFTKRGQSVAVTLDGIKLFDARITEIKRAQWHDLGIFDAEIGGFNTMGDLENALRRAGFRFKNLNDYELFRVQFQPVKDGPVIGHMWVGGIEMAISEKIAAQKANVEGERDDGEDYADPQPMIEGRYYHSVGQEDEFSDCVCEVCKHASVAECKNALCECCEMDDESKKRYNALLTRAREAEMKRGRLVLPWRHSDLDDAVSKSDVNPSTLIQCPSCGAWGAHTIPGGYTCKTCGITARVVKKP